MNDPDFDPYLPPRAKVGFEKPTMGGVEALHGNPWLTIWTRPRATIRGIVSTDPTRNVLVLAALSGMSNTLNNTLNKAQAGTLSIGAIVAVVAIGGTIGGIIGLYITASLLTLTAGWLGGRATAEENRAALAWASVPGAVQLPFLILMVVLGSSMNMTDGPTTPVQGLLLLAVGLMALVFGIWSIVLNLKCVSEVNRFSTWKAFGAAILSFVIIVGALLLLVLLVYGLMMAMK